MAELKPCPFCGGEAELERSGEGVFETWYVTCIICGASNWENTEAEAVKTWNTRAYRPCCPKPCTPNCWYEGVE